MSNKTTKELLKEAWYLRNYRDFLGCRSWELEKVIRDTNTKGTQTGDGEVCERCLREQYKQRLIDEKMYNKKLPSRCCSKVIPALRELRQ